ncbi:shootin-1 isoform X2 [Cheilinus undulatus]|uniref:shootin-1 isoform X2 n=1 Tax=Cheilinus undulatus TaxID=241271 RepID=UPI001BD1E1CB|nr:shootin-1 isoform X2 [Cheilinus undulatus]
MTYFKSDEKSGLSSEDEGDIQCEILERERDEANQRLSELEEVSSHLLKEMNVLEIQFQIERSCRESAEALAVKVSQENKVLKRKSQMLMPLIPELPENIAALTFDPETDSEVNSDPINADEDGSEETLLLKSQAKIAELQASVDSLLAEKLQLEQKVEDLTKEQVQLQEQLALEVGEKEVILRKLNKQSKTMNKIKRVSQLVSEEFTEMSQKLELEQGLRAHAEVFAHQMLVQQKEAQRQSVTLTPSSDTGLQLQQALEQISTISTTLSDIQRCYHDQIKQNQGAVVESSIVSELQELKEQLERNEGERRALETQLTEANTTVTQLQEEVKKLQEKLDRRDKTEEPEGGSTPAPPPLPPPPPPPPLPPPPPPSAVMNPLDFLKSRRKDGASKADQNNSGSLVDMKLKAVDEMMERIKKGVVLRPMKINQDDNSAWKDQRSENRKSAIQELKGMLDNIKRQPQHRLPSRRGMGRHVGEAELMQVLQRRRRAMGENRDPSSSTQTQDPQPGPQSAPAAADVPWAGETGSAPVLRRLRQNREKRDSRIRASALIINQES